MKTLMYITLFASVWVIAACSRPSGNTAAETAQDFSNGMSDSNKVSSVITESEPVVPQNKFEYYYVSRKSGIYYNSAPQSKFVGRIPSNTMVKVISRSDTLDTLKIGEETMVGEWFEVERENDTIYIFSSFLTDNPHNYADVEIFYPMPLSKYEDEVQEGYVNLSESDRVNYDLVWDYDFNGDPVRFTEDQKSQFFNFSPGDTVYIYNLPEDSIIKFVVEELPAVAYVDLYSSHNSEWSSYDYIFGLGLGEKYTLDGESFTFIGKENPFQTREIEAIRWNKVDNSAFPVKRSFQDNSHEIVTFEFVTKDLKYYLQKRINTCEFDLVVIDDITDSIIFHRNYYSGESIKVMCTFGMGSDHIYGWTGKVFKNKSPIIYGLESHVFGCPKIVFLAENEPPIEILCDNRH